LNLFYAEKKELLTRICTNKAKNKKELKIFSAHSQSGIGNERNS